MTCKCTECGEVFSSGTECPECGTEYVFPPEKEKVDSLEQSLDKTIEEAQSKQEDEDGKAASKEDDADQKTIFSNGSMNESFSRS